MKKAITVLVVLFSLTNTCLSQTFFSKMAFEAGITSNLTGLSEGAKITDAFAFYGETRYHFSHLPIDVGIHLDAGRWDKGTVSEDWEERFRVGYKEVTQYYQNFLLVSHYNFRPIRKIKPFVGIAVGLSRQITDYSYHDSNPNYGSVHWNKKKHAPCLSPQMGISIGDWVRLSGSYKWTRDQYQCIDLSVGVTWGKDGK